MRIAEGATVVEQSQHEEGTRLRELGCCPSPRQKLEGLLSHDQQVGAFPLIKGPNRRWGTTPATGICSAMRLTG